MFDVAFVGCGGLQSHPLYKLADKIDWEKFDTAFFSIPPVIMPEEKLG
ncbi:hypothetical protein BFO_0057 [Tannerella forsythia 92A2]|uniref:Uncharacterized protein n=1 Tax=Tannerella forsythia (strain ATCC 43037 / JCM 10827 / CCUG 21028 A / KCTC 5666 / FDC 338) TaxID=203275 RepID=G8UQJ3_TANFA|nr:hypothetical protein BFO_0057 [Tannerella forsythia 92A2]